MFSFGCCVFVALAAYATAYQDVRVAKGCESLVCPPGQQCKLQTVYCIRAPCPSPIPTCVPKPPRLDKPGSCPRPIPGRVGICLARCSGDDSCPGDQKCCGNCPRDCTKPVFQEKPGRCPNRPLGFLGRWCRLWTDQCSSDSDCYGSYKCCDSGCRKRCSRPFLDTPRLPYY